MSKLDPNMLHRNPDSLRGTRLRVEASPEWVVRRKVKNSRRLEGHPVTLLLLDRQIFPEKATRYTRYVRRLETPQAVQDAGRIEIDFDPAIQCLSIHDISIFRNGELSNMANLDDIKIIQRERGLEQGIYAGSITALILLKDVRAGDVIDIAHSIHSDDAIFPDHYWFMENFQHTTPVVRQYFSWLSKNHEHYTVNLTAKGVEQDEEQTSWGVRKIWSTEQAAVFDPEPALPVGLNPFQHISLSSYDSWQQVASDIASMWDERVEPGEELPQELEKLRAAHTESDRDLIESCVAFVRDNIRYQGIEVGRLGLVPEKLREIWNRRFGDCKEKTNLLCWLLRECGFEATPALVSTTMERYVANEIPAPIFNHVVVHLLFQQNHYWIDPTDISLRGTLGGWTSLPFQKALLISHATTGFSDIADPKRGNDRVKITEDYDFRSGTAANLSIRHDYYGRDADGVRHVLGSDGRNAVQKMFVDIVQSTCSVAELDTDMQVLDDPESNHLTLSAQFKAKDLLKHDPQRGTYFCEFVPHSIVGKIVGVDDKPRTCPLGLTHPVDVEHVTRIGHPDARGAVVPRTVINNEYIQFEAGSRNERMTPELFYRYRSKSSEIPANAIIRYRVNLDQIGKAISMVFECSHMGGKTWR